MTRGELVVLRLGHRPGRDDRMTTHVGLTARALGADRFVLAAKDASPLERIDEVTDRFGGPFRTTQIDHFRQFLSQWSGSVVHLTMYGLPIQDHEASIPRDDDMLIIVGAEKVPFEIYERADWNVAVTNQPHSEVASLAICLDRLTDGGGLERTFTDGTHRVIPQETGKQVINTDQTSFK